MNRIAAQFDGLIGRLGRRGPLTGADHEALSSLPRTVRTLEPASYIIREGDPPRQCAVLLTGFAYRQKTTGDGGRQILSLHIPGDMLDLQNLFLAVSDHNIQMFTRGEVAFIPREALRDLVLTHPGIAHTFFVDALVDASIFREWVVNVGRRDARGRLAHILCEFALRLEIAGLAEQYRYDLPMTQEQLADALGLTPVHVNRTLKTLDAEGLIERNRRTVRILDWQRMRSVADFNERYLHLDQRHADPWAA